MYQEFRTEIEEGVPNNGGTGRVDIASFLVGHAYLNREGDVDRTMSYTLGRHGDTKPRNPHGFDTFEGGTPRVYRALMVTTGRVGIASFLVGHAASRTARGTWTGP